MNISFCRTYLEAEYTYQLRKDVIPLMVDGKYRPDGWLGFIVGSKFWIDFSEKHKLDSNVTKLVKELGTRGKIEVVESIVQGTDNHKPSTYDSFYSFRQKAHFYSVFLFFII